MIDRLSPTSFESIAGWRDDDHLAAFVAFCRGAKRLIEAPDNSTSAELRKQALIECADQALSIMGSVISPDQPAPLARIRARQFFERCFTPHIFKNSATTEGFVTGYFEPELHASLQPTDEYTVALYRRPDDLIEIDASNQPDGWDTSIQYGRQHDGTIIEYYDRSAIQGGALEGQNLELVWLKDKTDAYFVHVQGSARLILPDGQIMRVGYAVKNGHAYTSLGKIVCDQTGIAATEMTADRLADWMRSHPESIDQLMANNRSYIFFNPVDDVEAADSGPIGAANVALTPGRSLAVDPAFHQYGLPIWAAAAAADDLLQENKPFSRLMVAQDTGSAIVGPQRGDIYVGTGPKAGLCAGRIRHAAHFTLLVPTP